MGNMKQNQSFTIGVIQDRFGDGLKENQQRAVERVAEAKTAGAQVVCLPELFSSTYFCAEEKIDLFNLAEPIDGPTVTLFRRVAKDNGIVLIVPFFEKRAAGVYHNSVVVVETDGAILGVYRKMHIPHDPLFFEKYYFTPGEASGPGSGFKVFNTTYGKVGVLICWDQWYPEAARITSLLGAEVLFYPTAIGWHPKEKADFGPHQVSAWQTMQRSHAIANGVYVGAANRFGFEPTPGTDGIEFFGSSFISDPFGIMLQSAPADRSAVLTAEVKRQHSEETRRNWPFLRDRRIDAYGPITSRFIDQLPAGDKAAEKSCEKAKP